jgi:imidazoleglycerol phosphate dehydratase HisB
MLEQGIQGVVRFGKFVVFPMNSLVHQLVNDLADRLFWVAAS